MKEAKEVIACVVDSGMFLPVARRLAQSYQRVLYWSPDCRANKSVHQLCVGDGFERVERVKEFWPFLADIDLFVFPDSDLAGLQLHLESLGKAVFGSRLGQEYEQDRMLFLRMLEGLDLQVPKHEEIIGIAKLREHLREREDVYVKISHLRGDMETKHWRNWAMDEVWLDNLAVRLLPRIKDITPFLVFDQIDTDLELGADLYCVDDQLPALVLQGYEGKDKAYFAAVTRRSNLPEPLGSVLDAFTPLLAHVRYRNQLSIEVRVKGEEFYFIDATQRGGLPSTSTQLTLWKNFPEIVWAAANGELVEPEPAAQFAIETIVTGCNAADAAEVVELPADLERWCHLAGACQVDGLYIFPPGEGKEHDLGWLCSIGDTPRATLATHQEHAALLPAGIKTDVESLASVIAEIEHAQAEGHEFTEEAMPEPTEVIDQ